MNKSTTLVWTGFRNAVIISTVAALATACATEGDSRAAQGASSGAAIGAGIGVLLGVLVELAYIDLKADGFDGQIWGTTTLGYDAGSGFEISTRFNTLPDALDISGGRFDTTSRTFEFSDAAGTTLIRFETPDRYTVTTTTGGQTVESYVLTRS